MAIDKKYGTISVPGIPDDEPIFILRAKDSLAVPAITNYSKMVTHAITARRYGVDDRTAAETHVDGVARAVAEAFGVDDVRFAPKDSPLAYGAWKGVLAAAVRETPIPPGSYAVSSSSDFGMIAFEVVVPRARLVVRGAR
jgi:hypothetical protein